MTIILDGSQTAAKIIETVKQRTQDLNGKPTLATIIAGSDPASRIYVANKHKQAEYAGFNSIVIELPDDVKEIDFLEQIYALNDDPKINAILVQLPLPEHLDKQKIIDAIDPLKDVDCFTSYNFGWLALGNNPYVSPCTPKGIIRLLNEYNIRLEGANVIIIGRSTIVGKPLSFMLLERNATTIIAHSKTKNLKQLSSQADIVISAIGKSKFITEDYIKENAVVIDVGINRTNEGISGDVDFENVKNKASFITPVPKGIGPMTIAMLLENTFELYRIQQIQQKLVF